MPVEVIIGAISAIKGEFGPSLNGEGLSEGPCFDPSDRPQRPRIPLNHLQQLYG